MSENPSPKRRWPRLPEKPVIVAASVAVVLVSLVAFPTTPERAGYNDPVAEAAEAYRSLIARMETNPDGGQAAQTSDAKTGGRAELDRSLFAPKPKPKPIAVISTNPAKPKPPPLPILTGILIDGEFRQARLSGQIVGEGEEVAGYRVVKIESDSVLLVRAGHVHRIEMKGSP